MMNDLNYIVDYVIYENDCYHAHMYHCYN